ncbi:MAG: carbohydrate binding domain-containing protein [Victivallales bacterium]|nr:carbohydrate binding domain-containing protein [Victivallales bacterium]
MKRFTFIILCTLCAIVIQAENLIRNPTFDQPLTRESRIDNTVDGHAKISLFTEDLTWNKCLKFELLTVMSKDGRESVGASVVFGGNNLGVLVKPNTTYRFSFEVKGNGLRITPRAIEWTGDDLWKNRKALKPSLNVFKAPQEWQKFSGTFTTGPEAKSAVFGLSFWWDTQYGPMIYKPGDFILIDNLTLEEQQDTLQQLKAGEQKKSTVTPPKTAIAPIKATLDVADAGVWKHAGTYSGFTGLRTQDKNIQDSSFKVIAGKEALFITVNNIESQSDKLKANVKQNGAAIWQDDLVEIFFGPVAEDRKFSQFVVSAGGGRYFGDGNREITESYDQWTASVSVKNDSWSAEIKIPYTLLGWKHAPPSGTSLAFNIARQRTQGSMLSSWSRLDNSFHDIKNFGTLIIGSVRDFAAMEAARLRQEASRLKNDEDRQNILKQIETFAAADNADVIIASVAACSEKIRRSILGSRKFIISHIPMTTPPVTPMIPRSIISPPDKISIRAAVNDLATVPLAITNLTSRMEEYRVVVFPGNSYDIEHTKLRAADGKEIPAEKIRLLRGVRVKDRDSGTPVVCFDPLVDLDDAAAVSAPSDDSALVWVQIDCRGVAPGKYQGVIRVIPLSEPSSMKLDSRNPDAVKGWVYKGQMQDIPIELEVLPFELPQKPVRPWDYMRIAFDEESFKLMIAQDNRFFIMSSWDIRPEFNPDGSIKSFSDSAISTRIRNHVQWAKRAGVEDEIRFGLGLSCYTNFMHNFGGKQFKVHSPEWRRAWKGYVSCIADAYRKNNIPLKHVFIEIVDEPEMFIRAGKIDFETLVEVHRLAKEAAPQLQTYSWLDCHTPHEGWDKLIPYLDAWGFYSTLLLEPRYQPLLKQLRTANKNIWMYRCNTAVNSDLHSYYRTHAWVADYTDSDVAGFFVYADATEGGWARFSWKQTPDGGIVYRSGDKVITTIRNECLKLGIRDIMYLETLRMLLKNNPDAPTAQAAGQLLANASKQLLVDQAHNRDFPDILREQIIDQILKFISSSGNVK